MYLQGLVESKDKTVQAIREETQRNANMLLAAAKTRDVSVIQSAVEFGPMPGRVLICFN
jgi:hypothetical protein